MGRCAAHGSRHHVVPIDRCGKVQITQRTEVNFSGMFPSYKRKLIRKMRNEFQFSAGINERLWGGGGERTFVMRVMRVVADGTDVQPRVAEKNPGNLSRERKSLHDF